jgi:hypothetical protein
VAATNGAGLLTLCTSVCNPFNEGTKTSANDDDGAGNMSKRPKARSEEVLIRLVYAVVAVRLRKCTCDVRTR